MTRAQDGKRQARILALLCAAGFATMASLRACDGLLEALAREFGASTGQAGQTVSSFAAAYGIALLLYGPAGDRYGKFRVVCGATMASTIASLACALAPSLGWLVAFRALAGVAAAGVTPLAMAWVGDHVPYARRQEVLARLIGATILGMIAGQSIGATLADTLGWRSAFLGLALVFAACGALMWQAMRGDAQPVGTVPAGMTARRSALLVWREPWARRVLCFSFLEGVFVFAGLAFLPAFLHQRFGLPMRWAGAVLVAYGAGGLFYSRHAGALVRRFGETGLARIGGALLGIYFAGLALLPGWGWAVPACAAGGCGFYMLHNTLQTHATQMAPRVRGTAVTLFSAALFLGHSLGVGLAARVVDASSAVPVFAVSALALPVIALVFASQARAARTRMATPLP